MLSFESDLVELKFRLNQTIDKVTEQLGIKSAADLCDYIQQLLENKTSISDLQVLINKIYVNQEANKILNLFDSISQNLQQKTLLIAWFIEKNRSLQQTSFVGSLSNSSRFLTPNMVIKLLFGLLLIFFMLRLPVTLASRTEKESQSDDDQIKKFNYDHDNDNDNELNTIHYKHQTAPKISYAEKHPQQQNQKNTAEIINKQLSTGVSIISQLAKIPAVSELPTKIASVWVNGAISLSEIIKTDSSDQKKLSVLLFMKLMSHLELFAAVIQNFDEKSAESNLTKKYYVLSVKKSDLKIAENDQGLPDSFYENVFPFGKKIILIPSFDLLYKHNIEMISSYFSILSDEFREELKIDNEIDFKFKIHTLLIKYNTAKELLQSITSETSEEQKEKKITRVIQEYKNIIEQFAGKNPCFNFMLSDLYKNIIEANNLRIKPDRSITLEAGRMAIYLNPYCLSSHQYILSVIDPVKHPQKYIFHFMMPICSKLDTQLVKDKMYVNLNTIKSAVNAYKRIFGNVPLTYFAPFKKSLSEFFSQQLDDKKINRKDLASVFIDLISILDLSEELKKKAEHVFSRNLNVVKEKKDGHGFFYYIILPITIIAVGIFFKLYSRNTNKTTKSDIDQKNDNNTKSIHDPKHKHKIVVISEESTDKKTIDFNGLLKKSFYYLTANAWEIERSNNVLTAQMTFSENLSLNLNKINSALFKKNSGLLISKEKLNGWLVHVNDSSLKITLEGINLLSEKDIYEKLRPQVSTTLKNLIEGIISDKETNEKIIISLKEWFNDKFVSLMKFISEEFKKHQDPKQTISRPSPELTEIFNKLTNCFNAIDLHFCKTKKQIHELDINLILSTEKMNDAQNVFLNYHNTFKELKTAFINKYNTELKYQEKSISKNNINAKQKKGNNKNTKTNIKGKVFQNSMTSEQKNEITPNNNSLEKKSPPSISVIDDSSPLTFFRKQTNKSAESNETESTKISNNKINKTKPKTMPLNDFLKYAGLKEFFRLRCQDIEDHGKRLQCGLLLNYAQFYHLYRIALSFSTRSEQVESLRFPELLMHLYFASISKTSDCLSILINFKKSEKNQDYLLLWNSELTKNKNFIELNNIVKNEDLVKNHKRELSDRLNDFREPFGIIKLCIDKLDESNSKEKNSQQAQTGLEHWPDYTKAATTAFMVIGEIAARLREDYTFNDTLLSNDQHEFRELLHACIKIRNSEKHYFSYESYIGELIAEQEPVSVVKIQICLEKFKDYLNMPNFLDNFLIALKKLQLLEKIQDNYNPLNIRYG